MSWSVKTNAVSTLLVGLLGCGGLCGALHADSTSVIPEDELLDVGVVVLDPGVDVKLYLLTGYEYINTDLRQSEAAFIAVHLMRTLQETESFGLVRMMPSNSVSADLFVSGRIRESAGRRLALELEVLDATGRRWLEKKYKLKARPATYAYAFHSNVEPFQELYDEFADDLILTQRRMKSEHLEDLRHISELRFAAQLAPGIFGGYLTQDRKGRIRLDRLPAVDDPMLERVRAIQTRDEFFLDLLTDRYQGFYASMDRSYDNFRATRFEVEVSLNSARAQSILANRWFLSQLPDDSFFEYRKAGNEANYFRRQVIAQTKFLDEISSAYVMEVDPLKLELDGEVIRFEGTIEDQYRQWQELLERIFEAETGMSAEDREFSEVRSALP